MIYMTRKSLSHPSNSPRQDKTIYSLSFSRFPIISRPVTRVVAHKVGKSRVLEKVSA